MRPTERKRHQLLCFKGMGPALSSTLTREVYYRQFVNRRQVANFFKEMRDGRYVIADRNAH